MAVCHDDRLEDVDLRIGSNLDEHRRYAASPSSVAGEVGWRLPLLFVVSLGVPAPFLFANVGSRVAGIETPERVTLCGWRRLLEGGL